MVVRTIPTNQWLNSNAGKNMVYKYYNKLITNQKNSLPHVLKSYKLILNGQYGENKARIARNLLNKTLRRKQNEAATRIQSLFRGVRARNKYASPYTNIGRARLLSNFRRLQQAGFIFRV